MMLSNVNVQDRRLTDVDAVVLTRLMQKRDEYITQGRSKEAHGVARSIRIHWEVCTDARRYSTGWGGI
jgi:hypothetical protein